MGRPGSIGPTTSRPCRRTSSSWPCGGGGPPGDPLDALSQENLDNQRAVVKNEKRLSYDNQPYGTWQEKLLGHIYPPDHPYHHTTIGSMEDLDAASLEDVGAFFRTWYAPNNAVLSIVGDVDPRQARAWVEKYFGAIPPNPALPPFAAAPLPLSLGGERRETVEDRVPCAHLRRLAAPSLGDERLYSLEIAAQVLAGGKAAGSTGVSSGRTNRPGLAAFVLRSLRSLNFMAGHRPAGRHDRGRRGGLPRGGRPARRGRRHRRRAPAGQGAHRDR